MRSTHDDNIDIPQLPTTATKTSIFPDLHSSLISIGQFCDAGCTAIFDALQATILFNNKIVMTGTRKPPGLWYTDIPTHGNEIDQREQEQTTTASNTIAAATTIIDQHQAQVNASIATTTTTTTAEHIKFLHAAAFSPVTTTWIDAIRNGHFLSWPGLTVEAVNKHLPKSFTTAQGHMDQSRMNYRSTKIQKTTSTDEEDEPIIPVQEPNNEKTQHIYAATAEFTDTSMIYSDLTGKFPHTSKQGNKYILIIYAYDGNQILAEPMKERTDHEMIRAYKVILEHLKKAGLSPKLQRLDNEASKALQQFWMNRISIGNSYRHTATEETQQKEQSEHSRIISSQAFAQQTPTLTYDYGTDSSTKQK